MILPSFSPSREIVFLFVYATIAVLSQIGPGTYMGYSSVVLPVLSTNRTSIKLDEREIPLFASLPIISQICGSLLSVVTMKCGRRIAMTTGSLVCATGWIIIACSYNVVPLFIGRILTGFSSGLCAVPATIYLGEISPLRWRTVFTSCGSLFISIGIVLVYIIGFLIRDNWQGVAAICILFPAASAIATILFLPESPTWLLTKDREDDAKKSLFRIRGLTRETSEFRQEFVDMVNYVKARRNTDRICLVSEEESWSSSFCEKAKAMANIFKLPEVWKPFLILISYFFFQQFSGLYVMIAYAVDMIINSGIVADPFLVTMVLGTIQVIGGIVAMSCSTKVGRRKFSIISGIGIAISLAILAVHGQFFESHFTILPLICVIMFVASGSFGFIIIPWAMIGELYPAQYVNILGPMTTCFGGLFNFAAVQLYPQMAQYGITVAIYVYCIVAIIATVFIILLLPETQGKTKAEIEERFKRSSSIRS